MIVAKTNLKEIPENCWNCDYGCSLPLYARNRERLKMAYKDKRHKDCPLREVDLNEPGKH